MVNRITKSSIAVGAVLFAAIGSSLAPAQAALLTYNLPDATGGTATFTLDTSVVNSGIPSTGVFTGAIKSAKYQPVSGNQITNASPIDLKTYTTGSGLAEYQFFGDQFGAVLDFVNTGGNLTNALSSAQGAYTLAPNGNSLINYYAGTPQNRTISSLTVTGAVAPPPVVNASVPEPSATGSLVAFGAIGAGWLLWRKKKDTLRGRTYHHQTASK